MKIYFLDAMADGSGSSELVFNGSKENAVHWSGMLFQWAYESGQAVEIVPSPKKHCECPLNGGRCCACGEYECLAPASEATLYEDEMREGGTI